MTTDRFRKSALLACISLLVILGTMTISGSSFVYAESANPDCEYLSGWNINGNNYSVWSTPVRSYLTKTNDGYMRVQGDVTNSGVTVVYYDNDFNVKSRLILDEELPVFGAFYEAFNYYYIITGQKNINDDNNTEVVRVTKYEKDTWEKIKHCSLYGNRISYPFNAASCRIDMNGKWMVIRSGREEYKGSDGVRHQTSFGMVVDTTEMKASYSGFGPVSHSFNQFIKIDGFSVYSVDHGDGYPRCIFLQRNPLSLTYGTIDTTTDRVPVLMFPGGIGENNTGASVGGLELTNNSILIAGNSVIQDDKNLERQTRNIFVASIEKHDDDDSLEDNPVNINWLTDYQEGEETVRTPHLIKIRKNEFMLLWTRGNKLYYVFINDHGETLTKIYEKDGALSDCVPVVADNMVTWYTWEDAAETFYQIPLDDVEDLRVTERNFDHEYEWVSTSGGNALVRCRKCGNEETAKVPTSYTVRWKTINQSYTGNDVEILVELDKEDTIQYTLNPFYSSESDITFGDFTFEADDPENCIVDQNAGTVTFVKAGKYSITVYPTYNQKVSKTFTFAVAVPLESVVLSSPGETTVRYGDTVTLNAETKGGKRWLTHVFTAQKPDGSSSVLRQSYENTCSFTPDSTGIWKVSVSVTDSIDGSTVESNELVFTVIPQQTPVQDDDEEGSDESIDSDEGGQNTDGQPVEEKHDEEPKPADPASSENQASEEAPKEETKPADPTPSEEPASPDELVPSPDNKTPSADPISAVDTTPAVDPAKQYGEGNSSVGKGASSEEAEAAIAGMTSDSDLPGAVFRKIQLKSKKQTSTSIRLSWKKVSGAKTYVIYGNKCGKANKMKRLAKSTGKSKKFTKVLGKKVKKGTYYKFMIVALDKDNKVVSSSKIIHVATKGGKVGNVGKITTKANKNKVSIKKGKTFKLGAKQKAASKKLKVKAHRKLSYETSNAKIATVSKSGKIKGKKKGSCYVYVYAQSGVFTKIKVTVK